VIAPQGPRHARELAALIEACDETIPFEVCEALAPLVVQLRNLEEAIARLDRTIVKIAQKDETARRLMTIPGFGPRGSSPVTAMVWRASAHLVISSTSRAAAIPLPTMTSGSLTGCPGSILRTARDRLIPDTPDFSVPASRAAPDRGANRERLCPRPRTTSCSMTRSCL